MIGVSKTAILAATTIDVSTSTELSVVTELNSPTVIQGDTATFSMNVDGAVSYQLQKRENGEWVDIPGANSNNYTTSALTTAESRVQHRYQAFDGSGGSIYSNIVTLIVLSDTPQGKNWTYTIPLDVDGFTDLVPSADSRLIYVDTDGGNNDTARPYSPSEITDIYNPPSGTLTYAWLSSALAQLRPGYPDWIIIKRGSQFNPGSSTFIPDSGRSATERAVITTYGTGARPLLNTGVNSGFVLRDYNSNLAIRGLDLYANGRDPDSPDFVGWANVGTPSGIGATTSSGDDILQSVLIEDCVARFYSGNISFSGNGLKEDIVVRRNQILNSYAITSHSQGFFAWNTDLLLEGNLIDHNGWYQQSFPETSPTATAEGQATYYNHNVYLSEVNRTVIRENITSRSASIGFKLVSSGDEANSQNIIDSEDIAIYDNLILEGEIGISAGGNKYFYDGHRFGQYIIENNVLMHIGDSQPTNRTLSWGIDCQDWFVGTISNNYRLYSDNPALNLFMGIKVHGITKDVTASGNVFRGPNMPASAMVQNQVNQTLSSGVTVDAAIVQNDAERRDLTTFLTPIIGTVTGNGVEDLVNLLKTREVGTWDTSLSVGSINTHLTEYVEDTSGSQTGGGSSYSAADIPNVLQVLNTNDAATVIHTGGVVSELRDMSTNNHHLTQTVNVNKPTLETDPDTGEILIRFDGHHLERPDAMGLTGNPDLTAIFVIRFDANQLIDDRFFFVGSNTSPTAGKLISLSGGTDGYAYRYNEGNQVFGPVSTGLNILVFQRSSADSYDGGRLIINGVEQTQISSTNGVNIPNLADEATVIGAGYNGSGQLTNHFNGALGNAVIVNRVMTNAEINDCCNDLVSQRTGLTWQDLV